MTKDARDNRRGCVLIGLVVAALIAALVWGIMTSRDDSRAVTEVRGSTPPARAPADQPPSPPKGEPSN